MSAKTVNVASITKSIVKIYVLNLFSLCRLSGIK